MENQILINEDKYHELIIKEIKYHELEEIINKAIKYCEDSSKTIKSEYFSDVLKILKGEEL